MAKSVGQPDYYQSVEHQPTGGTWLTVDQDSLYCGSGPDLLRFPKQGGQATKLTTVAEGERVGPLISDESNLYWANNRGVLGTRQENLAMMPTQGGPVTDLGNIGSASTIMRLSVGRTSL